MAKPIPPEVQADIDAMKDMVERLQDEPLQVRLDALNAMMFNLLAKHAPEKISKLSKAVRDMYGPKH